MDELQHRLTRLAERAAPPPREDLAHAVVTRHRAQRRQTIGLTAVAAAVAAVVVTMPLLLDGPGAEPATATGTAATGAAESTTAAADALTSSTRGSLAGDAAFVETVRQLSWTTADDVDAPTAASEPPLDSRHVVFAGDVAGGRWALVVGQDTIQPEPSAEGTGLAAAWFTGPPGAAGDQLQPTSLLGAIDPAEPVALYGASTGALVVVAAPGDDVLLSRRPEVAADASVSRDFAPVDAPEGVAVLALSPAAGTYDEALRYRVIRDGAELVTRMPDRYRADGSSSSAPSVTWLGESATWAADQLLTGGADHVLTITGLTPGQIGFGVVWAGDLPASGGQPAQLRLMSATLPSGASYLEALYSRESSNGPSSWCGADLRPAGPPLAQQVFAVRCAGPDPSGSTGSLSTLVLIGPSRATSVRLTDGSGELLEEHPLADGIAVLTAPEDVAGTEFLAADGTTVGRTDVMGVDGMERLTATPSSGD
jgi:hypothetical protein